VLAHDGKSLKGSYDTASETKMAQVLRAFAVGTKIILGHVAIMVKSNEIPAMQALVRELGLAGVLCTADAMHCQIKTIEAVKASGGEALLQVKANQPSLEAAFEALPVRHEPEDCHAKIGKIRRNRQEKRVVEVFRAGRLLDLPDWQTHAVEAVRVTRTVQHQDVATGWKWRCTHEIAWYASSGKGNSAADYAAATRGHSSICIRATSVVLPFPGRNSEASPSFTSNQSLPSASTMLGLCVMRIVLVPGAGIVPSSL